MKKNLLLLQREWPGVQVIKHVPGELLKPSTDPQARHAKLQAQHAQAAQQGSAYGVHPWSGDAHPRPGPLDLSPEPSALDLARRRALQAAPSPPPPPVVSQQPATTAHSSRTSPDRAPHQPPQHQRDDYEDPDRPARFAPLSIHVLGCMAAKAKGLHKVAQVRGAGTGGGSPPRSAGAAAGSAGRRRADGSPPAGRREALPWCTPLSGDAPPPPSLAPSPAPEPSAAPRHPPPARARHQAGTSPSPVPALDLARRSAPTGSHSHQHRDGQAHQHAPHMYGAEPRCQPATNSGVPPLPFWSPEPAFAGGFLPAAFSFAPAPSPTNLSLTYLAGDRVPRAGSKPGLPPEARSLIAAGRRGAPGTAPARILHAASEHNGDAFPGAPPFHSPHAHPHAHGGGKRGAASPPPPFTAGLHGSDRLHGTLPLRPPLLVGDATAPAGLRSLASSPVAGAPAPALPAMFRPRLVVSPHPPSGVAAAY